MKIPALRMAGKGGGFIDNQQIRVFMDYFVRLVDRRLRKIMTDEGNLIAQLQAGFGRSWLPVDQDPRLADLLLPFIFFEVGKSSGEKLQKTKVSVMFRGYKGRCLSTHEIASFLWSGKPV